MTGEILFKTIGLARNRWVHDLPDVDYGDADEPIEEKQFKNILEILRDGLLKQYKIMAVDQAVWKKLYEISVGEPKDGKPQPIVYTWVGGPCGVIRFRETETSSSALTGIGSLETVSFRRNQRDGTWEKI